MLVAEHGRTVARMLVQGARLPHCVVASALDDFSDLFYAGPDLLAY
jgi:hypothetical protein